MYSPELQSKIAIYQARLAEGTLPEEEWIAIIREIRGDRKAARAASDSSRRAKAKAEIPDADDLLKQMMGE
jgi:hypothetical protein